MAAADKGHIDAVNILLALDGIDINAQDKVGWGSLNNHTSFYFYQE